MFFVELELHNEISLVLGIIIFELGMTRFPIEDFPPILLSYLEPTLLKACFLAFIREVLALLLYFVFGDTPTIKFSDKNSETN